MRRAKLLDYAVMTLFAFMVFEGCIAQAAELKNLPQNVKFRYKSNGQVLLATLSGKSGECKKLEGAGEFTSERLGQAEYKFKECGDAFGSCTGLTDTTGNITVSAEFHTRHLLPGSEGVNVAVLLGTVHFSCFGILFVAAGCQATMDLLTTKGGASIVNLLLSSVYISFLQQNGDQKPTEIDTDNSLGMENCIPLLKESTSASEGAGLLGEGTIEKFENPEHQPVTELVDLSGTL